MKLIALLLITALVSVNASDEPPKCYTDLMNKLQQGQVCKQGDTDCITAVLSLEKCAYNCEDQYSDNLSQTISCVQANCKSSNTQAQSFLDEVIKCANSSQIVLFSMLVALVFIII
ncbi:hypothetical protein TTHERM_00818370 (macronuclear) [Tetrahymena thermophila SB210]|uniref:Transmembrane protein n=1 Tax=Tetrahymena thermophila (strain SB210) TaxID=312017 RepID=Q23HA9_TETTS|nr:hypothetical protein TTHERM_00818370 [Tetrahymena thermophila SB210]EAR95899.1 hypothetical protein TTHERM_00818370 [Tetrahymena thermophila SB210]|eukprot:XP_001016144.1 hypothetical protein TTHERM_00818370 [Tetrahymena thermophila SB210]